METSCASAYSTTNSIIDVEIEKFFTVTLLNEWTHLLTLMGSIFQIYLFNKNALVVYEYLEFKTVKSQIFTENSEVDQYFS